MLDWISKWWLEAFSSNFSITTGIFAFIVVIFILFCLIKFLFSHRKDISNILNQWFDKKTKQNEILQIIYNDNKKIRELTETHAKDKEQTIKVQRQLSDSIATITQKLDDMENKHDKRIRAELKDKISQQYRYYHEKQEWNDIEKEALNDLIEEYESAGGKNSFVHTIVQPESYTWNVVERK